MNKKVFIVTVLALIMLISSLTLFGAIGNSCTCYESSSGYDCYRRCRDGGHGACVADVLTQNFCIWGNVCILRYVYECEDGHIFYLTYEVDCWNCKT